RAIEVNWLNLALGHRRFVGEGATYVVNEGLPSIYDANFVYDVTASTREEVDALFARARATYPHCPELTFRTGPGVPTRFEAALGLIGTERTRLLVMLLEGALQGTPRPLDIRPLDDDAG